MTPSAPNEVITVQGLTKHFGQTVALDHFDLSVKAGQVHGFLGPNGAGKSTTIRILLGLLRPTSGQAALFGLDPVKDRKHLHQRLAYVPGDVNLWPNMTGGEVIDLIARMRGGLNVTLREQLCRDFDLDTAKKCHTYSKGNRQKVALIAALASQVELYILDEPTAGLDPLMEVVFQHYIKQVKAQGRTVLLSSHILAQVEALSDHITIIRQGQRIETGRLDELRHLSGLTVTVSAKKSLSELSKVANLSDVTQVQDNTYRFHIPTDKLPEVIAFLADREVTRLESHPPTLEQLMLQHYQRTAAEEPSQ